MSSSNPIVDDYKRLQIFNQIGIKLLQQLKTVLSKPPYNQYFKSLITTEKNEMIFTYWDQHFKTRVELFFKNNKMPTVAFLATYYIPEGSVSTTEEIISYPFDIAYNINNIYSLEDFAEPYAIEFHENLKKTFSDNHLPLPVRMSGK